MLLIVLVSHGFYKQLLLRPNRNFVSLCLPKIFLVRWSVHILLPFILPFKILKLSLRVYLKDYFFIPSDLSSSWEDGKSQFSKSAFAIPRKNIFLCCVLTFFCLK